MGLVKRDHVQAWESKHAQVVLAQRHRSLFHKTGKLRTMDVSHAVAYILRLLAHVHSCTSRLTSSLRSRKRAWRSVAMISSGCAHYQQTVRSSQGCLLVEQNGTLPLMPPLRKVLDGSGAAPALLSASQRTETEATPTSQVIS
jgi:hypothetical protein